MNNELSKAHNKQLSCGNSSDSHALTFDFFNHKINHKIHDSI